MSELLERSARYIDEGVYEGPQANNPMDSSFHEIADGIGVVCAFSHVWGLHAGDGLTVFDTSLGPYGAPAVQALRTWRTDPFETRCATRARSGTCRRAARSSTGTEGRRRTGGR